MHHSWSENRFHWQNC